MSMNMHLPTTPTDEDDRTITLSPLPAPDDVHRVAEQLIDSDGEVRKTEPVARAIDFVVLRSNGQQMTRAEVVHRIGQPARSTTPGGDTVCPVCEYETTGGENIGPHLVSHWKDAEVANPPRGSDDDVKCPKCSYQARRSNLKYHLKSEHGMDLATASGVARTAGFDLDTALRNGPSTSRLNPVKPVKRSKRKSWKVDPNLPRVQCPFCPPDRKPFAGPNGFGGHVSKVHGVDSPERRKQLYDAALDQLNSGASAPDRSPVVAPITGERITLDADDGFTSQVISPTDAALAVVMSQANGVVNADHLPRIVRFVDDARTLSSLLREGRNE